MEGEINHGEDKLATKQIMRSKPDRIRHAVLFEIILLIISTLVLTYLLNKPMAKMGGFGILMSLCAMGWNYLYNLGFDHLLVWLDRPLYKRGVVLRAIHALMFEVGLTVVSIPVTMIWLNYTLIQALLLDLGFLIAVPIYTWIFNFFYDHFFPVCGNST